MSTIQSIYHDFGSAVIGGDTGVILQNRGSFFSLDERHPNRLEPGKRSFHTIIPAVMLKDRRPVLAFGTMGGEWQPQTQAALVTRMVDFGYDVQQAIEAPRFAGPTGCSEGCIARSVAWPARAAYISPMSLRPLDTTADGLAAQRAALDELGPEARVRAALAMSESIRRIRLSGLRSRHPDASEGELVSRFIADAHGVRLGASG